MKKVYILIALTFLLMPFTVKAYSNVVYSETIDSIDGIRFENNLVYYSDKGEDFSGANVWGYEVAVDQNNVVVESSTNVKMVRGGFILSAHGTKKTGLMEVQVGDIVNVDLEAMTVEIYRDPIESSYLRSLSNKDKAYVSFNYAKNNYVIFDQVEVELELEKIDLAFDNMSTIYNSDSITAEDETQLVTLAYEIQGRTEKVIYMTTETKTIEVRAVWHRPNATDIKEDTLQGIINLLDRFKELGFNAIYLESFWNGYVSGRSDILDTHPNLSSFTYGEEYGNDYLLAFITEANKRGLDVHAWVHTFNAGNATNLSSAVKQEWLVENYQGDTLHPNTYGGSYYLDPSNQEVLDFVLSMLEEMVEKYQFKGIQLDYIRYYDNNYSDLSQIRDSGYNSNANQIFLDEYQLSGDVRTLILDTNIRSMWFEWRQKNVTNAVKYFVNSLKAIESDLIISADVVGEIQSARNTYMQDWLTWVENGYIDLLCPMIYTSSNSRLESLSETIFNQLEDKTFLSSGIAPVYYGDTVQKQQEQIVISGRTGGSAIFASHNVIGNTDSEKSLKDGVYRNEAVSPFADMDIIVSSVMTRVYDLINENIEDLTVKRMFLDDIEDINVLEVRNPGEYKIAYDKVKFMKDLTPYITDSVLSSLVKDELESLEHTLDVRITRELIVLGYYNPETDDLRPDPTMFEYDFPDDEDNDDGNNGGNDDGETSTTTTEVDTTEQTTDTDISEDSDDSSGLFQFLIPAIILLVTIILMVVNVTVARRKV
ncbi:MAG: family 10 glycosylhydrolase [Candidatus Izemoplasmatales bacterium]